MKNPEERVWYAGAAITQWKAAHNGGTLGCSDEYPSGGCHARSPDSSATGTTDAGSARKAHPIGKAALYSREIGRGQPIIVLHGGPDFDQSYLLPEMDELANAFRLIYYDQRGRGRSADRVLPEEVTLTSEVDDLDKVREYFHLKSSTLLGHSWGAVLALEYAVRHPQRVSHLILMNPAPVSASGPRVFSEGVR